VSFLSEYAVIHASFPVSDRGPLKSSIASTGSLVDEGRTRARCSR
jgi:hypothetical protein